jgi:hypothetical protein
MRGVREPFPSESDPGTARDGNSAGSSGAVARIGGVIFKAVIMVRKRWMRWRGEKGRGGGEEERANKLQNIFNRRTN